MLRVVGDAILFLREPAFIELKALLVAYLLVHHDYPALATLLTGLLFFTTVMNAVAYSESVKSLLSISIIIRQLPPGTLQTADTIDVDALESKYGYVHRAFRTTGPYARDAGNLTILHDPTGRFIDYQCGASLFGSSYLIVPSGLPLDDLPLYQKYLALHEIGHGSMMGISLWTRARSVAAGGIVAGVFGVAVAHFSLLGAAALFSTLFATILSSRKIVVESEAEVYADSYAIRHIATTDRSGAHKIVKKLLDRLREVRGLSPYDERINMSRLANLEKFDEALSSGKSLDSIAHPSILYLHYLAAILLGCWALIDAKEQTYGMVLAAIFGVLTFVTMVMRRYSIARLLALDKFISAAIKGNGYGR